MVKRQISEQFTVRRRRVRGLSEAVAQLSAQAKKCALGSIELEMDEARSSEQSAWVILSTVVPALGDYELMARIDHLRGDRVYIRPMAESHLDFAEVRRNHATMTCDHCGVRRNRKVTYLLKRAGQGEVQVGSSCLSAYVGESDPRKALLQAEYFSKARELVAAAVGREPQDSPRKIRPPSVDEYLAHVAVVIRSQAGFVRKADVDSEEASTAVIAMENYRLEQLRELTGEGDPTWLEPGEPEQIVVERAKIDFKKLSGKEKLSGYDRRLLSLLNGDRAWPDGQGILATLFERVFSLRNLSGQASTARPAADRGNWLGEKGDLIEVVAEVKSIGKPVDSRYGPQYPHSFITAGGELAAWFATNIELEVGSSYRIAGKVKRQDSFRGDRVTVLTGCRTEPAR